MGPSIAICHTHVDREGCPRSEQVHKAFQVHLRVELMFCCRSGRVRVNYDDLSQAEVAELLVLVRRYVDGMADIEELPIDSIKRIRETYKTFKAVALGGGLGAAASGQAAAAYAARNSTVVSLVIAGLRQVRIVKGG